MLLVGDVLGGLDDLLDQGGVVLARLVLVNQIRDFRLGDIRTRGLELEAELGAEECQAVGHLIDVAQAELSGLAALGRRGDEVNSDFVRLTRVQ